MEGNPPSTELIEAVVSRSGLPMNAFSSFLLHGKIDPSHREDLNRVLDQLPLTEEHHTIIGLSMIRTIQNVKEVLANLNNGSPK
jgi:hypothetical protein